MVTSTLKRLWAWFSVPPAFASDVDARRATLLLQVLRFLFGGILLIVALALTDPRNTPVPFYVVLSSFLVSAVWLVHRGKLALSGWLLCSAVWCFVTAAMFLFGGLMANNCIAYVLVVMIAGAILGNRPALFFAAISALGAAAAALIEAKGLLPTPLQPASLLNGWIAITVTVVLVAVIHNLSMRTLDAALNRSSASLAQLREVVQENETRGLHGAALSSLSEKALSAAEHLEFSREAARAMCAVLPVDRAVLIELDEEGWATYVDPETSKGSARVAVAGTPLAGQTEPSLRCNQPALQALLARLGAPSCQDGLLMAIPGRSRLHGYLGVTVGAAREWSVAEEQFLRTTATLLGSLIEREQAADRAQRAQKMEIVGRLAGGVAHDFNNLLTVIIGASSAVREQGPTGVSALLDDHDDATSRATLLVKQLLAFSRRQVVAPVRLDLVEQVRHSLPMQRRLMGDDIVIEEVLPAGPLFIQADRGNIEQIVLNLLVNAREAMPNGGKVFLEVTRGRDGAVLLRVRDTGLGMDELTRQKIFLPFFTTKADGTGLGLATVADIARRHGATIEVDSTPGLGTTFTVRFAEAQTEAATTLALHGSADERGQGRLLLADDHPLVRTSTARMLEGLGYQVVAVANGLEARAKLKEDPTFDLLITDVNMPELSGLQLAAELTERGPAVRVLLISGYVDRAPEQLPPSSRFLAKPFNRHQLAEAVAGCLKRPAGAGGA